MNRALRHSKADFDSYVDSKFGLSSAVHARHNNSHTTSVDADYGYFPRERAPLVGAVISDGEGAIQRRLRLEKERQEIIRVEKEKEQRILEEKRKKQMERELQGGFDEEDHIVEPEESGDASRQSTGLASPLTMSKFKSTSSVKRGKPPKQMWDDTPHLYAMRKKPHEEARAPGTPLDRHLQRQTREWPTAGRCGECVGCAALLRCENVGGYKRVKEVVDIIRLGLVDEEMTLKKALEEVRRGGEKKGGKEEGRKGRKSTRMEKRGSFLSRRRR